MGEEGGGGLSTSQPFSTRQRTAAREARGEGDSHMKGAGMLDRLALRCKFRILVSLRVF